MKFLFKNTKIISTFGPSVSPKFNCKEDLDDPVALAIRSRSSQIIRDLFFNGVNCVRFNFSHGFYEENDSRIFLINGVQKGILEDQSGFDYRFLRPVVFMADTKGPEIRVFDMTPNGVSYKIGQIITINCTDRVVGSEDGFSVFDSTETYNMANDCVVGNMILVEDGKLTLEILEVDKLAGKVKVKVKNNCLLKTNKRINLPGADYSMDFLSNKDIEDIKYAIDKGFEYVALSFVNSKKDVESVRSLIKDYCEERGLTSFLKVYSKIETMKSCENIDEIIESSDGIMIARGDLGLEIPYYVVPFWTKRIIEKCRFSRKPVIVATQMLDSLERNVVATRAEVSDVYRAAELCADCTMLSGETAQGLFPVVAVKTMTEIVFESERRLCGCEYISFFREEVLPSLVEPVRSLCDSLLKIVESYDVSAILIVSEDLNEDLLMAISSMKLSVPLFNFVSVSDLDLFCSSTSRDSLDYRKFKKVGSLSLYRGISLVLSEGALKSDYSLDIFEKFVKFFSGNKSFKIYSKNVVYLHEGSWRI